MWTLFEPVHAVTYFAPEARAAFEAAGLRGFWRGYFAGRAAPLGAIGPAPVVAAFFGFAPAMVTRAIPDVWSRAAPDKTLVARTAGAVAALDRLLGGDHRDRVAEAVSLLDEATEDLDCAGRVLGGANAALPRPDDPLARLWQATTLLREHRGDGHVAALVSMDVTGCAAIAWRAAIDLPRGALQPSRGWTDEQWQAATDVLIQRGWLTDDGAPTDEGLAAYGSVEAATDIAAGAPWRRLGPDRTARLAAVLRPLAVACAAGIPYPNPIGLPAPAVV
jgi:hypothetical protein